MELTLENVRENLEKSLNDLNEIRNFCKENSVSLVIRSKNQFSDLFISENIDNLYVKKLEVVTAKKL